MRWIIFDFAGVVGRHQPQAARDAMVTISGAGADPFWTAYWTHRDPYDRGLVTAEDFWASTAKTLETDFPAEVIRELIRLDITSWLHPDPATLDLISRLKAHGHGLALLSNAPHELADALDDVPWMEPFRHRFFSSRLACSKPSPEIYQSALAALGATPEECVFIDDRQPNVAAAEELGLRGLVFTGAGRLAAELDGLLG
ncbi:HAD family hydrolase [Acrocarpospora catenulata]|uniref:HAD family hydrolase n=1 Tax=Acrocarpospora catenulata TaxID=2836182 RepID=UPI001BD9E306|nr:HAD family phosphatase [Acrocarpospora catenulata]